MHVTEPSALEIEEGLARITRKVNSSLDRRRTVKRVGMGAALVGLLTLGGAGVATAVAPPRYLDLDGMVTTTFAPALASCVSDAGWRTVVLSAAEADPILTSNNLDSGTVSVVRTFVTSSTEPSAGRAITRCQQRIAKSNGVDSIVGF